MKKLIILFVVTGLVFSVSLLAEEKADKTKVDVKITLGAKVAGKDGSLVKAKEYDALDDGVGPMLKAKISGQAGNIFFNILSSVLGSFKQQAHDLSVDFNRILKQSFTFTSLYHRLDHDPLTNLDVVSHARSAVYVTDFDPTKQYHITRDEFESKTKLTIPQVPFMKLYVNFRNEHRVGEYQARTLSKCSACHVVAKSRSIDNFNRDIQLGSIVKVGSSNIDYSYTHNQFKESGATPTNHYLKVEHPEKIIPVFTSRIGVGDDTELPFDEIPESKKGTHLIRTSIPVGKGTTITAQYLNSTVNNVTSDLQWSTNSFAGGFSTTFGNKGFLNLRFRHIKIANDSYFVNINEPVDVAGPNVGKTYAEASGVGTFGFMRDSALSRTMYDLKVNFRYRLAKPLRLQVGYEFKNIDREHYDVVKTKSHTIKGKFTYKPVKKFKLVLEGKLKSITDPFANQNGGIAPLQQDVAYSNPFVGVQFFQWHMDRRANLTNFPESVMEMKSRFSWNPSANFALSGNILYKSEENDNLEYTGASWGRDMTQWALNLWYAPSIKLMTNVSYYNYTNNYNTIFSIAALEGCGGGIIGGMTGTLTDMMDYEIDNKTLLVNVHFLASKKFSIFGNFNYNTSEAVINNLSIDTTQLPFIPGNAATELNFDDFGEVSEYSKLEMKQVVAELGINYAISKQWMVNGSIFYYLYDDIAQYLFTDTTGKSYSFFVGFTWKSK